MDFNKVININYAFDLKVGEEKIVYTISFSLYFLKHNNFFFYKNF